jgi:hypothetical protein
VTEGPARSNKKKYDLPVRQPFFHNESCLIPGRLLTYRATRTRNIVDLSGNDT